MNRLRVNTNRYFASVIILTLYDSIMNVILLDMADYELFSYIFGGGLIFYGILYLILMVTELLMGNHTFRTFPLILTFLLMELLLFSFSGECLLQSIVQEESIHLLIMFHLVPLFVNSFVVLYRNTSFKLFEKYLD
ncbi:MAG: hypothetical protein OEW75_00385 [Cyclobacteriaceae bacterium]|nr:hypothetical protein [Cyclobacteriaceae bacterium]